MINDCDTNNCRELKQKYVLWMQTQGLSPNTIATAKNDSFYILRHNPNFDFYALLESATFEEDARQILHQTLLKHSKGNIGRSVNGYLAHLRRLRRFMRGEAQNVNLPLASAKEGAEATAKPVRKRKKSNIQVPTSCPQEVQRYLHLWETLENYSLQEAALDKLFMELAPSNDNISDILLKAAALNDFYSTNIFSIYPVAKHILSLDIDARLHSGDVTLVDDMKVVEMGGKVKNLYSFTTKYCSHHNPLAYPIYDSYVQDVLCHFRDVDAFCQFKTSELKQYETFKQVLHAFQSHYKLTDYNLKQLDQYLWLLGKEYFPKSYNRTVSE